METLNKIFDFSDVLSTEEETKENKVSECCGATVTLSGFCTECKDNAVGEDPVKENVLSECCGASFTEDGYCTKCGDSCVGEDGEYKN